MDEIFRLTRVDPVTGIAEPVPASERINALMEHPKTRELVRGMDPQALYSLVHEAGLNDAVELVLYASPQQVQAIVDFDCWTRDDFELARLSTWMEVLLQRDDDDFNALIDEMDPEPLVLWLREQVGVFYMEEDQDILDTIDGPISTSPDGVYALVIPDEDNIGHLVRHFLHRVYAKDIIAGHRFLEASRHELSSHLTETAYQYRESRLGDLGFVPFHEALEVYAALDPPAWSAKARGKANDPGTQPIVFSEAGSMPPVDHQIQVLETKRFAEQASFFTRAMGALTIAFAEDQLEPIVDSLMTQFRALVNRVHIADLGNPGDMAAARAAADRADAHLGIGLQLSAGEDLTLAARILATNPLKEIHRAGYSATARLATQARRLVERGNLSLVDGSLSLLDAADQDLVEGLLRRRPTMSGTYDTAFRTLQDVELVARRLGEIAFTELIMFGTFRHTTAELAEMVFDPERNGSPAELVTFRTLFATRVLGDLVKAGRELAPLPLGAVQTLLKSLGNDVDAHSKLTAAGVRLVCDRSTDAHRLSGLATAYSARIAGWLLDEVGDRKRPLAYEVASQVLLIAP